MNRSLSGLNAGAAQIAHRAVGFELFGEWRELVF